MATFTLKCLTKLVIIFTTIFPGGKTEIKDHVFCLKLYNCPFVFSAFKIFLKGGNHVI